jgi:transcriptional regulator with XRE-family HTH domain
LKAPGKARQRARQEFGERLVTLRRRAGLSQPELARQLGELLGEPAPRTATMSAWENGSSEPQATEADALATIFGVSLDVLTGRAPLPPPS